MKDEELLQDALGQIGDDLILEGNETPKRKTNRLPKVVAAAACFALLLGLWQLMPRAEQPDVPTWPDTQPTTGVQTPEPEIVNLWEREGFRAYSLIYSNLGTNQLSADGGAKLFLLSGATEVTIPGTTTTSPEPAILVLQTAPILLSGSNTVKVESLIAGRYVAYLTEDSVPVFYDTQEGVAVDLKQRILGEDAADPEVLIAIAAEKANEMYPGLLQSENNMSFFRACIFSYINHESRLNPEEWPLDTDFMDALDGFRDTAPEDRPGKLRNMCWEAYCIALQDPRYPEMQPYRVKFLAVDVSSGKCIVQILDMVGNVLGTQCYDLAEDSLSGEYSEILWNDAVVSFSNNGRYFMVAWNRAVQYSEGVWGADFTQRHLYEDTLLGIGEYVGEEISYIDTLEGWWISPGGNAASEGFLSDSGKVCYYKLLPEECYGKSFEVSSGVWFDRLARFDRDTDVWVFSAGPERTYFAPTALTGDFVRLICDDTVAIMEREGQYYAYLLGKGETNTEKVDEKDYSGGKFMCPGEDITEKIRTGEYPVAGHERLRTFLSEGYLYKQDLFSGDPAQKIARADQYVLSGDSQFAFVYCNGSDRAECYNVVTLESCVIALDPQLYNQLQGGVGAVFQMTFNEQDNSLVLSFYLEESVSQKGDVDFFGLLAELDPGSWAHPEVNKEYSITEAGVGIFRKAVQTIAQEPDGVASPEQYYPTQFPQNLDREGLMAALQEFGVAIPKNDINVNGTKFVLYDAGAEKLSLIFGSGWGLRDQHPGEGSGFWFLYESQEYTYQFVFHNP